ncbi:hypothetical protein [Bradyrhizobium daqingense]|uniref:hypothetical protein n=1 Tax=Bradyrhizobium daqingense TaxID=993502 RepID=UPI0038372E43
MAAPANTAAFSIIARLLVITIILWCFSTQARAQAQPETAQPTVKKSQWQVNHAA